MLKKLALPVVCVVLLGCKAGGQVQQPTAQTAAPTEGSASAQSTDDSPRGFSFGRLMEFVGLQKSVATAPGVMPPAIIEVGNMVDDVTAKAAALNMQDPPEVTSQKAQSLLDSLGSWEQILAKGKLLINEDTTQALNGLVGQLRMRAQSMIQNGANPETIAAVQHLAGQLKLAYGGIAALFSEGAATYQAVMHPRNN